MPIRLPGPTFPSLRFGWSAPVFLSGRLCHGRVLLGLRAAAAVDGLSPYELSGLSQCHPAHSPCYLEPGGP